MNNITITRSYRGGMVSFADTVTMIGEGEFTWPLEETFQYFPDAKTFNIEMKCEELTNIHELLSSLKLDCINVILIDELSFELDVSPFLHLSRESFSFYLFDMNMDIVVDSTDCSVNEGLFSPKDTTLLVNEMWYAE